MCGRFGITFNPVDVEKRFHVQIAHDSFRPRYNIAPGQDSPIVMSDSLPGTRRIVMARFGLIPSWSKPDGVSFKMINARSETVAEKPAYRRPFKEQRCLVLASLFYEWKTLKGKKQPYLFRLGSGEPFAFAGIFDSWTGGDGKTIISFSIITTAPNKIVKEVHDRMPVILDGSMEENWLSSNSKDQLLSLLKPFPAEMMESYPVSDKVNNISNDSRDLIKEKQTLENFF